MDYREESDDPSVDDEVQRIMSGCQSASPKPNSGCNTPDVQHVLDGTPIQGAEGGVEGPSVGGQDDVQPSTSQGSHGSGHNNPNNPEEDVQLSHA